MYRRIAALAGVAAVALALTACGPDESASGGSDDTATPSSSPSDDGIDKSKFRGAPVPKDDPSDAWEKKLPSEPGSGASMDAQIEYALAKETASYAHQYDKKGKADCPDVKAGKAQKITCSVTYFGQKIDWKVSISAGDIVASYDYKSDQRVMSRDYLENALRYEAKTTDVMCELDDAAAVVDPEKVKPIACHSLKDGEQTTWDLSVGSYGDAEFYEK
ncbi:MAG TPA: hypothetical protein VE172_20315 [Stackebrandtia sp.]|jgi:hypothetical protein|uniref:hypothetical protein n=1 Tax=Stackebrandtia sp. TaxID=2023065 RepID=UPI002D34A1AD|nr:hypothetical protein [Stackebrandtia sp.]HZE41151.1 hypothetical protein [Stackebrandtia sp.]